MMTTMTRGRPKSFNDNEALERAMNLFWRFGYDATSMDQLVGAMEIPRQSLYRTFGDKKTLFLRALELYGKRTNTAITQTLLSDSLAIDKINAVFRRWGDLLTSKDKQGCMMQNTYSQSILNDKDVTAIIMLYQKQITQALTEAIAQGQKEGSIENTIDGKAAARTIISSINGLLSLARTNLPEGFIEDVLNTLKSMLQTKSAA